MATTSYAGSDEDEASDDARMRAPDSGQAELEEGGGRDDEIQARLSSRRVEPGMMKDSKDVSRLQGSEQEMERPNLADRRV